MHSQISTLEKPKDAGEAAIDGLLGGMFAGLLMGLTILLTGLLAGETPTSVMERFTTGQAATPLSGSFAHLAVSSVYGVVFSVLVYGLPRRWLSIVPGWLAGLLYAALLLLLAVSVLLPGLQSPLNQLPLWVLAAGHAVYGVVLGQRVYPQKRDLVA